MEAYPALTTQDRLWHSSVRWLRCFTEMYKWEDSDDQTKIWEEAGWSLLLPLSEESHGVHGTVLRGQILHTLFYIFWCYWNDLDKNMSNETWSLHIFLFLWAFAVKHIREINSFSMPYLKMNYPSPHCDQYCTVLLGSASIRRWFSYHYFDVPKKKSERLKGVLSFCLLFLLLP